MRLNRRKVHAPERAALTSFIDLCLDPLHDPVPVDIEYNRMMLQARKEAWWQADAQQCYARVLGSTSFALKRPMRKPLRRDRTKPTSQGKPSFVKSKLGGTLPLCN